MNDSKKWLKEQGSIPRKHGLYRMKAILEALKSGTW